MYVSVLAAMAAATISSAPADLGATVQALPVLPAPPSETAEQYFDVFDRFCLSTGGVADASLAVAEAAGWPAGPQEAVAHFVNPAAPVVHFRLGPTLPGASRPLSLLLSSSPPSDDGREAHICAVDPSDSPMMGAGRLAELVTARLGVKPLESPDGPIWFYSGGGPFIDETPLAAGGAAAAFEAARTRPVFSLNLIVEDGQAALVLGRMGK